ncbi:MAG TPA: TlpA disulfide reductase family protein [bacterium]|nr:TlpA disulfide reductase family protein [bacterium]
MKFPTSIFLLGLLVLSASCTPSLAEAPFPKVPDFTLPALAGDGPVIFSGVNKESPVLLVFWASWCPSCVEEIPVLNEIQKKFSPRGLKILAVNVEESRQTIRDFQKTHPMNYPVLLDEKGKITEKFGLAGVPAAVLAQKGGDVLYFGFSLPADMEKLFQK